MKTAIERANEFASGVLSGEIVAGPSVRLMAKRHFRDIARGRWELNAVRGQRVVDFFEKCLRLTSGRWASKPFLLFPWQVFLLVSLFGWIDPKTGFRRFRQAYIETAKGSGKTPLAAGVALYMTACDDEPRAETYLIARTGDQAKIPMSELVSLIKESPGLTPCFRVVGGSNVMRVYYSKIGFPKGHDPFMATRNRIERMSSDRMGAGKSGYLTHCLIAEEYHEHHTSSTKDMFSFGTKSRTQSLEVMITNAGEDYGSPCGQEHLAAKKILNQEIEHEVYFAMICDLDKDDDPWNDESCWIKTNPSLPDLPSYDAIRARVRETVANESKKAVVGRLYFCIWGFGATSWLHLSKWEFKEVSDEDLMAFPCYLSLDLARKNDLAGGAAVWDLGEGRFHGKVTAWMPGENLQERSDVEGVPWVKFARDEYLTACSGMVIDFALIAAWVQHQMKIFDVVGMCYDPHMVEDLKADLELLGIRCCDLPVMSSQREDLWVVPHSQGFERSRAGAETRSLWMPGSINVVEELVSGKLLTVSSSPVLNYAINGVLVKANEQARRMFLKRKSVAKIDVLVSLTMGLGFAKRGVEGLSGMSLSKMRQRGLRQFWNANSGKDGKVVGWI